MLWLWASDQSPLSDLIFLPIDNNQRDPRSGMGPFLTKPCFTSTIQKRFTDFE